MSTAIIPPAEAAPPPAPDQVAPAASRAQLRAAWARARARNAFRHRTLLATASGVTLVLSLLALILVPRQASRAARAALPQPGEKVDTLGAATAERAARQRLVSAESVLAVKVATARARARVVAPPPPVVAAAPTTTDPAARDSLAAAIAALERLQARAQTSPLPSSYRALADAPELRGDARVRALVDSLDDVEREREAFGVVSGVDPIYVSLTNRVTQLGRAIGAIAERRHTALRDELAAATAGSPASPAPTADSAAATQPAPTAALPVAPPPPPPVVVDTTLEAAVRDSARHALALDSARLARVREQNVAIDRRAQEARVRADLDAPPAAMLVASLALAAVIGFAGALAREVRRPLVADGREAERVTRTRVLAEIRPEPMVDRTRRRADVEVPALIDPSHQSYRLLYLSLAATGAAVPLVTVIADDPAIAATIVANLAAIGAEDGRSTLVIDADLGRAAASVALGLGLRRGLAEVVRGTASYGDALRAVTVGRGITVDVLPAGAAGPAPTPEAGDALRLDLARLAARYDFTVVSAASTDVERASHTLLVAPDVIVCAHEGQTPVTRLAREIARLRDLGATVRGIVLWDDEAPEVRTLAELRSGTRAA